MNNTEKITPETKNSPLYSTADTVFAWICFLFGYLFCRTFPAFEKRLGGFLFILTVYVTTYIILKIKKVKIPAMPLVLGASAIVLSFSLILTNNDFIAFLVFAYSIASYCYFVYAALGNAMEKGLSDYIVIDYFKAILIMPFRSILNIFDAVAQKKAKKCLSYIVKIVFGAALAFVPTVIVLGLLSYDDGFISILSRIFSFDLGSVISQLLSIIFAVPIGMYTFGLFSSSSQKLTDETFSAEECEKCFAVIKIMPKLTALSATIPVLFIYVVYFISQWKYYISGFTGALPDNFSYAEYARQGFFQLCAVSVINLLIIIAIVLFMRREKNKPCILLRVLTSVFCVFTLVLISTAVAKLIMYINCYGLTQKRIYAMWLMAVIAIVYIIIAAGQFTRKIKTVWASLAVFVVLFGALALCNVNGIIAEYNVDRYIEGTLDTVDVEAMDMLGDAAVPALVRLAENIEERKESGSTYPVVLYSELTTLLNAKANNVRLAEIGIFSFNLPSYNARTALIRYGLLEK